MGVEAIRTLRAIPDLDAGRIYFKRQAESGITALTPSAPLHTGHLQAQPANQTFVIMSRGLVQLPPNSTTTVPCFLELPLKAEMPEGTRLITERNSPLNATEQHQTHPTLGIPGAIISAGPEIPATATAGHLQCVAIELEVRNFGTKAITLQANEQVTETMRIDVPAALARRQQQEAAEQKTAATVLQELQSAGPFSNIAKLAEEISALLVNCHSELLSMEPAVKPVPSGQPKVAADEDQTGAGVPRLVVEEDDGLDDVESVAIPETVPEERVLEEALQTLRKLWAGETSDLSRLERFKFMLLLVRHLTVFRYVLRPPSQLLSPAEPLRIDPNAPP